MNWITAAKQTLLALRDWRFYALVLVGLGGLVWIVGADVQAILLAHLSTVTAIAIALIVRKWFISDLSEFLDIARNDPRAAAIVVLSASMLIVGIVVAARL